MKYITPGGLGKEYEYFLKTPMWNKFHIFDYAQV